MDEIEGRKNLVSRQWKRKKGAHNLPQPPPSGNRTPNSHIWAHVPENMYYIDVRPGSKSSAITIWSESMIKEFGENYEETMANMESRPEPLPARRLPYPMLTRHIQFRNECRRVSIQSDPLRKMVLAKYPEPMTASATKYLLPDFGTAYEEQFKLEDFLPADYFPDVLLVNDPQGLTAGSPLSNPEAKVKIEATPRRYKLVYPHVYRHSIDYERPTAVDSCTAHLNLAGAPSLRPPSPPKGKHNIFRGAMRFDIPLLADTPDRSTGVVVKIADPKEEATLASEAGIYNRIYGVARPLPDNLTYDYPSDARSQRHLMEEWTGYNLLVPYIQYPVPVSAVVPKFYGYYEPEPEVVDGAKLGSILLLEDCGAPVAYDTLSKDHKTTCLSLLARLHTHGYLYNSCDLPSKILVQPGPLEKQPAKRMMEEPRFRIVGLGGAMSFEMFKAREMAIADAQRQQGSGCEDKHHNSRTKSGVQSILDAAREHMRLAKEGRERMATFVAKWKEAQRSEFEHAKRQMGVQLLG